MVVKRGVNEDAILPMARALPRHAATSSASSSTWTSAQRTAGGSTTSSRRPRSSTLIDAELPLEPVEPNYRGEVARRWRYRDGGGEIGVIASVTQPFCGDCTRARLSAEGRLYTCLFARARPRSARARARRRLRRRRSRTPIGGVWPGAERSLLRDSIACEPSELPRGRDVLHRRLSAIGTELSFGRATHLRSPIDAAVDPSSTILLRGCATRARVSARLAGLRPPARDLVRLPRSPTSSRAGIADRDPDEAFRERPARSSTSSAHVHALVELDIQNVVVHARTLARPGVDLDVLELAVHRRRAGAALGLLQAQRRVPARSGTSLLRRERARPDRLRRSLPTAPPRHVRRLGASSTRSRSRRPQPRQRPRPARLEPVRGDAEHPRGGRADRRLHDGLRRAVAGWAKLLWTLWPTWVWFTVMATGNHFWLDIARRRRRRASLARRHRLPARSDARRRRRRARLAGTAAAALACRA